MDGKEIRIQAPPHSGSLYFCYKKLHSFKLQAACDAYYRFTWVDIGDYGSVGDVSAFQHTDFYRALENSPKVIFRCPLVYHDQHWYYLSSSLPMKSFLRNRMRCGHLLGAVPSPEEKGYQEQEIALKMLLVSLQRGGEFCTHRCASR